MDKDLKRELERLQREVAALSAQVTAPPTSDAAAPTGAAAAAALGAPLGEAFEKAGRALPEWSEIEAAVAHLKEELEKHPVTGIAVAFALGLTIGQLLRR
jgi:ElaB/YqjD/DUF883 family membrane-anchored ribosome-binding protein